MQPPGPDPVDVVLLDLDGTLVDHVGAADTAVRHWLRARGVPDGPALHAGAATWAALEREHFARYLAGGLSFQEQRRVRVRAVVEALDLPVPEDVDADFEEYLARYADAWAAFPEVPGVLDVLGAQGLRLAVLSNGQLAQQTDKLRRTGLLDAVESVITSSELGAAKPDPAAFLGACERLGTDPSRVVHVGDDLHADIAGAVAAGVRVVWVNRTGRPAPAPAPEVEITSLAALPGLLR